jgi:mannose/fructose/N-acetylgalactosamine-specific phosphotransferase system component IIC
MPVFDVHLVLAVLGVAVFGGIVGLDRTAAGQFMLSQPVVAGPLTGWMLGDTTAGMVIGAALELVWLLDLPVGSFVPADATIGTVSATAVAALSSPAGASLPVIGFSVLLTTAVVPLTMKADALVRNWNARLADAVMNAPGRDRGRVLARAQFTGLAFFFLKSFVLYCLFIPLGLAAVWLFGQVPGVFHRAMSLFVKLLPLLGAALVAHKLSIKTLDVNVIAGFVSAAVLAQLFHAPALVVLILTATAGCLGAVYRERRA